MVVTAGRLNVTLPLPLPLLLLSLHNALPAALLLLLGLLLLLLLGLLLLLALLLLQGLLLLLELLLLLGLLSLLLLFDGLLLLLLLFKVAQQADPVQGVAAACIRNRIRRRRAQHKQSNAITNGVMALRMKVTLDMYARCLPP